MPARNRPRLKSPIAALNVLHDLAGGKFAPLFDLIMRLGFALVRRQLQRHNACFIIKAIWDFIFEILGFGHG